ncbi:hypothetical protein HNQ93_001976 [Hymenobacter luteus]|uniref:Carboxypeptidase-like regulatory domain-containing protein n=2 Tax=Hymenobacter TaxID=89966 RepID=A0A7W9T1A1_9BACT|nr:MULTISPECIES: carboxypeptidase-like regulatory domain-containing protein [Hymenobacter]MBB4600663.1 hypothetical protein [Hymenobacter latericoloratus]MBB6059130.1 hypothetical protein [Hymenobacter luteus]
MKHLLLFIFSLLCFSTLAQQAQVVGRVLDDKTGAGLPGVTILQKGTTNGVSSNSDGSFAFTVLPEPEDSVSLVFYSIGYLTQEQRVAVSLPRVFRLAINPHIIECSFSSPKLAVGLTSGVRYTPVGGNLRLYGYRWLPRPFMVPVTVAASYRTNLHRNYDFTTSLELPALGQLGPLYVGESVGYQHVRNGPANLSFHSYQAVLTFDLARFIHSALPTVVLGGGYAQLGAASGTEMRPGAHGYGYTLGLQQQVLPSSLGLQASVQATRWPGYWQWQGRLACPLPLNLQAGIEINSLRTYTEVTLALSRFFY